MLFDFYGDLLTDKQKQYFKDYFFEDMSLSEIANDYQISRNAIFDQIQKTQKILENYESVLGLAHKYKSLDEILNQYSETTNSEVLELITKIKELE